jgi:hypothetical protein
VKEFSKQIDWAERTYPLVPSLPRYNPIGFFLRGLRKGPGIPSKFGSMVELREKINHLVTSVTPQMLENTWREIKNRLDIVRAMKSAHIKKY